MAELRDPSNLSLLVACRVIIIASPVAIMSYTFFMKMRAFDSCKITVGEHDDLLVWIASVIMSIICVYAYDSLHREEVLYMERMKNGR